MKTVKLTSKRQVTFPSEVCKELGLEPGDEIDLVPVVREGEPGWVLRKHGENSREWMGSLREYGRGISDHSMDSIRESIAKGRQGEK